MSHPTTLLFGLSGVQVQHVELVEFGGRVAHVQTSDTSSSGCPSCGVVSVSVKGNVTTAPRDIPYGETGISVVWHKTRWRCVEPTCVRLSFTESIDEIPTGRRTTGRLRRAIGAAVDDACRSVAEVADCFGVTWPTAHVAVVEAAEQALNEPEPTTVLGIDETRRGRPRWAPDCESGRWVRTDAWDTGFVDLAGEQRRRSINQARPGREPSGAGRRGRSAGRGGRRTGDLVSVRGAGRPACVACGDRAAQGL